MGLAAGRVHGVQLLVEIPGRKGAVPAALNAGPANELRKIRRGPSSWPRPSPTWARLVKMDSISRSASVNESFSGKRNERSCSRGGAGAWPSSTRSTPASTSARCASSPTAWKPPQPRPGHADHHPLSAPAQVRPPRPRPRADRRPYHPLRRPHLALELESYGYAPLTGERPVGSDAALLERLAPPGRPEPGRAGPGVLRRHGLPTPGRAWRYTPVTEIPRRAGARRSRPAGSPSSTVADRPLIDALAGSHGGCAPGVRRRRFSASCVDVEATPGVCGSATPRPSDRRARAPGSSGRPPMASTRPQLGRWLRTSPRSWSMQTPTSTSPVHVVHLSTAGSTATDATAGPDATVSTPDGGLSSVRDRPQR